LPQDSLRCNVCGTNHRGQSPSPPPQRTVVAPPPSYSKQARAHESRRIPALIAVVVALIIFTMQLNWISVSVDLGGLSAELLANVATHEDIWEIMQAAGEIIETGQFEEGIPGLVELIEIFSDTLVADVTQFANRIFAFDTSLTIHDVPDVTGIIDAFTDMIVWEVTRATSGLGELEQNISISDLPNIIGLAELITDTIIREGVGWGMSPENLSRLQLETQHVDTAGFVINILRGVFAVCVLLLVIYMYLLVVGARLACTFGQICMVLIMLVSGGFAAVMHFGNRVLVEALGEYIWIGAGWYVYATLGLSLMGLVLITVQRINISES